MFTFQTLVPRLQVVLQIARTRRIGRKRYLRQRYHAQRARAVPGTRGLQVRRYVSAASYVSVVERHALGGEPHSTVSSGDD